MIHKKTIHGADINPFDPFQMIVHSSEEANEYDENSQTLFLLQSFRADGQIGSGTYGDLLSVTSKKTGKEFAVKIGRRKLNRSEYDKQLREVTIHKDIPKHGNIIRLEEAWTESRLLFVVTELCVMDLATFKHSPDFSTLMLFHAVHDVLSGVNHLHFNGVLHVDLKPANIFVTEKGICKIGDFGLATKIGESRKVDGDARYFSEDLLRRGPTTKTDIYTVSMTLLEVSLGIEIPRCSDERKRLCLGEPLKGKLKLLGREALFEVIQPGLSNDASRRPEAFEMLLRAHIVTSNCDPRPDIVMRRKVIGAPVFITERLPRAIPRYTRQTTKNDLQC
uniref:Protein kinase domain-containing protein n=1 Tax=Steinernema glaseri TaxID=37863 RepID=A0A1I7YE37_9BILA